MHECYIFSSVHAYIVICLTYVSTSEELVSNCLYSTPLTGPLGQDAHPLHVSVRPKEVQVFLLYCVHRTNHFRYKDVLQLADFLYKCGGIQCKFDGYDRSNPAPPNWSLWVEKMICESDYVLMVCSEALLNALQSSSHEFVSMQRGKFYADAIANIVRAPKFIPIFLNARECLDWVPMSLQAATSYELKVEELCNEMGNTEGVSLRIFNKRLEEHLHNEKYKGIASLVAQLRKEPLTVTPPQTPEVASTPCSSIQSSKPFPKPGNTMHAVVCPRANNHLHSRCPSCLANNITYGFVPLNLY